MKPMPPQCRRCLGDISDATSTRGWCHYCEKEVAQQEAKQAGRSVHIYLPSDLLEWFDSLSNKSESIAEACRQYLDSMIKQRSKS